MKLELSGKVALVTGASRGIGRAVALELARMGAKVVGTATSSTGAAAIESALSESGGIGRVLDVNDVGAVEGLFAGAAEAFGAPFAVLVNNAGITRDTLALRMDADIWNAVIDTDLNAVFRVTRQALRAMVKARFGRIVNITSVIGSMGNAGQVNYAAAKAGVGGMTRALAKELASRDITVNCVAPGFVDTDMTRGLTEAQRNAVLELIPAARLGTPDDVAAAVGFLVSPRAGYVNGVTLHVNGGMYMAP
jgi:3-oxoacyl-[acyl-carrier protein] reductase